MPALLTDSVSTARTSHETRGLEMQEAICTLLFVVEEQVFVS
jgi:hypothetical protein